MRWVPDIALFSRNAVHATDLIAKPRGQDWQYSAIDPLLFETQAGESGVAELFLAAYRGPQTVTTTCKDRYSAKVILMALTKCRECNHKISNQAQTCPNCGALKKTWPLTKFTRFYFIGGFVFVTLYALVFNPDLLAYLAAVWLLIGFGLALIVYGRARRNVSDIAGPVYLLGIAWLIMLFIAGIFRILDPLYNYTISN